MKILMASILDLERDLNGVVLSAREHAASLEQEGWAVTMVTPYLNPSGPGYGMLKMSSALFRRFRFSWLTLINLLLKSVLLFNRLKRTPKPIDLLHAHDVISAGTLLLFTRFKRDVYLQSHFHSAPWDEFVEGGWLKQKRVSYWIMKFLFKQIMGHPRLIFLPPSHTNEALLKTLDLGTLRIPGVLYPGIAEINAETGASPYLISVGNIEARKNPALLLQIQKELEALGSFYPLYIVGHYEPHDDMHLMGLVKKLQIRSDVILTGALPTSRTRELIAAAKLYIHSSTQESFGRTLVEAIAAHTPVVAYEYAAVKEILTKEAILPKHWTPARMAQKIQHLFEHPHLMKQLQDKQFAHYARTFTEAHMLANYFQLIQIKGDTTHAA